MLVDLRLSVVPCNAQGRPATSQRCQTPASLSYLSLGLKQVPNLHSPCLKIFGGQAVMDGSSLPVGLMASFSQGETWVAYLLSFLG